MTISQELRAHVVANFRPLRRARADSFPRIASLSEALTKRAPSKNTGMSSVAVQPQVSMLFATASVDMWLRAVHTFLVSTSLTGISDIWASVTGYYSSHYSIRAFAHLLGYFQLFGQKKIVQLQFVNKQHICEYHNKKGSDREHRIYWKIVKQTPLFASDPLFTENTMRNAIPAEVAHRDKANYFDHLGQFPTFRSLDQEFLKDRVRKISGIEFMAPPIPDVTRYPDLDSVQIVAYHRLVRYRDLVDSILGDECRFWKVHRNPVWANQYMDYQLTPQANLRTQFI